MWRKIRIRILIWQGIIYRLFIVCCSFVFFLIITREPLQAFKFSLGWALVNILLYFLFHYVWGRMFKLGKDVKTKG